MTSLWPWLTVAGLGAFHGANPAMGWLFAVALGLHRHNRRVVWVSLIPIAVGHAASIALALAVILAFGLLLDLGVLRSVTGMLILVLACYHAIYGHKHRVRIGMQTGMAGLGVWSFVMATSHGAGLMLVPAVLALCVANGTPFPPDASFAVSLGAVAVHTLAMLAVTGLIAAIVFEWLGLSLLRSAWINFDLIWTLALGTTGLILLFE
ncbi:hypothetical protein [Rhizobium sp. BK251]|uniref:hypothetical protein n=1 Tax=Rhizobium sp. BK251 TaxID=2512125 RepID=UPI0010446C01|nr:hypothetical protein [Rhizobium sp. BK251]TCL68141.1 hypothetical protein EV286_10968 [Rhizobium sp. BK251]